MVRHYQNSNFWVKLEQRGMGEGEGEEGVEGKTDHTYCLIQGGKQWTMAA